MREEELFRAQSGIRRGRLISDPLSAYSRALNRRS